MHTIEKALRNIKGKKKEVILFFGEGHLTEASAKSGTKATDSHGFSLAVDQGKGETKFYRLEARGKQAEVLEKYGYDGQPVMVVGRIEERACKEGGRSGSYEVIVIEKIKFLQYERALLSADLETLGAVLKKLSDWLRYLKSQKHGSRCIEGMELATQLVVDMIMEEMYGPIEEPECKGASFDDLEREEEMFGTGD